MTQTPAAAAPQAAAAAAKPAAKSHDLSTLIGDAELTLPADLVAALQAQLANRVTGNSTPEQLRTAAETYRRLAAWLQGMDGELTERAAEVVRAAEAIDDRVAEARGQVKALGEGVQIEQVEWLQHRIPAQQQDILRQWWPTDGQQSEYLAHEDVEFHAPAPGTKKHRAVVTAARRQQFGMELIYGLYGLVVHDLAGPEAVSRAGNEFLRGRSGLSRALTRHFANDPENPFLVHAQSAQELRTTMQLPPQWPEWPEVPMAQSEDVLSPEGLAAHAFDAQGHAAPLANADQLVARVAAPFLTGSRSEGPGTRLEARLETLSAEYRQPSLGESMGKAFRENAVYLGLVGAIAGKVEGSNPLYVTLGFITFCVVLGFLGRAKDVREAQDGAVRVLDQKLRQLAQKELASTADRITRAVRAFHLSAQSKVSLEVETQLRALKKPYDEQRRTAPGRYAAAKSRAAAHRSYCESMVQTIEGALRGKGA